MSKFYKLVVSNQKKILVVFLLAAIFCALCQRLILVNYDMTDYLPEGSPSMIALDKMEEEYDGGIPNARVMVHNVTIPEALAYIDRFLAVDGVTDVTWLDEAVDLTEPIEMQDADVVEEYYKDGNALYSITIADEKRIEAVDALRAIIGSENAMTGSAVSTAIATTSTVAEISKIATFAVLFVLLVLTLTTTSWLEPLVILFGLGVAVVINAGSNLIFREISFVTNAAGNILQLAVSLDYSIFLLHRFEECRKDAPNAKKAMVQALTASTMSISSSGLTTVIGFLALCLMRFRIGPDLGLALAKGIAISLITVFIFMPALILATYKWIDKTRHRSFMPDFHLLGRAVRKLQVPMTCLFLLLIVLSFLASNANDFYYGSSEIFGMETQLGRDTQAIEDVFGKRDTYVLMIPKDSTATQRKLSDALHELPEVKSTLSYVDTVGAEIPDAYLDSDTLSKLNSEHYTRMVLTVEADYEGNVTFALVEQIRALAESSYPGAWYLAGEGVSTYDLMETIRADTNKVNFVAIGAVFVTLLLSLRSLTLPVILVLCIETAVWLNLSIPYFQGKPVFYIAYLIISSVQLGATVDYAILFTDRYLEFRKTQRKRKAAISTVSSVALSIFTSGSVMTVVGFLLGLISTHGILSQLGLLLGKGTLCSMAIVMFVLPGLLSLLDGLIQRTTHGAKFLSNHKEVAK